MSLESKAERHDECDTNYKNKENYLNNKIGVFCETPMSNKTLGSKVKETNMKNIIIMTRLEI